MIEFPPDRRLEIKVENGGYVRGNARPAKGFDTLLSPLDLRSNTETLQMKACVRAHRCGVF